MKQNSTVAVRQSGLQAARLGNRHGYRFDGDTVSLNAKFTVVDSLAHQQAWALQLWACASAPIGGNDLAGHLVAEIALPPIGEIADEVESFEVRAFANTPAGAGEHVMVLALVSGGRGQFNEVHDLAAYARREQFVQPRLQGNVGYRIEGNRVEVNVERIENPRGLSNLSGSLALELWALNAPYQGGAFEGQAVAGVVLGSLAGQAEWVNQSLDLIYNRPSAGQWFYTLMLREWTAAGFITRDYTNFTTPVTIEAEVKAVEVTKPEAKVLAEVKPEVKAIEPKAKATVEVKVELTKPAAKAPEANVKKVKATKKSAEPAGQVSINTASKEQLVAVKGLPEKVAEGIIAKRPFTVLDEVQKVKGMGAKLLAKLRSQLKL
jgi:DNA uptake protein ComE-like DNA-binding protein